MLPRKDGALEPPFLGGAFRDASGGASASGHAIWEILQQAPHSLVRPPHLLQPEIEALFSCGQYVSVQSPEAWSDWVRQAKHLPTEEREQLLSQICGVFCGFLETRTPLLNRVEGIVPVPANPARYALRGMSLPNELGQALHQNLGLPLWSDALRSVAMPDLQMRGMDHANRSQAVKGSMVIGERTCFVGRTVLLVDDVVSSGSTLREAARLLLQSGAVQVYAACLASCLA